MAFGWKLTHVKVLLLPHLATFWNVESAAEVTPDAFAVVKLHHPRPDMLLLGTGAKVQVCCDYRAMRDGLAN